MSQGTKPEARSVGTAQGGNGVQPSGAAAPGLRRTLTLPMVVLYGLGVTIGAGIYVLIGATAGRAGLHAPLAFVLAALVMVPTALSYGELSGRLPVSAGAAAYVRRGFNSGGLALLVGLLVVAAGVVSSAAISLGAAGYIREFVDLPGPLVVATVVILMGLVAAWGIAESVTFAGIFTLIEVGGLMLIIGAGAISEDVVLSRAIEIVPSPGDTAALVGIMSAGLLAFFAFIGFEDMVNIAEETHAPERTLPAAIAITLIISTALYVLVVSVAVLSVPVAELAASEAPLALVFERLTGASPRWLSAIAIVAVMNGIIVQIIMASRVIYGLASQGALPSLLGQVHPLTRTPVIATVLVVSIILVLALGFRLEGLAEATSQITLGIFALVNLALLRIKLRREPAPAHCLLVPVWVPIAGAALSLMFLAADLLS